MTKIMIIHNIAWSHYRAVVLSELNKLLRENEMDLFCIHIAFTSKQREKIGEVDLSMHLYPFNILFNKPFEDISALSKTTRCINEVLRYKPNILILCGWNDIAYWISLIVAKFIKTKVIVVNESTEMDKPRKKFKEIIKKQFMHLCDAGFPNGSKASEYLQKLGMASSRIFIVPCVPDVKTIRKLCITNGNGRKSANYFIFVGRLSQEKNIETLISSFGRVKQYVNAKDWKLLIVGDGPLKESLGEFSKELGIDEDIIFLGGMSWKDVVKYYVISDSEVFILPSISETWGLVVNESMLCGLPVIVSNRCGAAYDLVKEGENGFTFDPYNIEEIKDIMLKFVNGDVDIKKMGERSKEIIKDYTPEKAASQMVKGIKYVLGIG